MQDAITPFAPDMYSIFIAGMILSLLYIVIYYGAFVKIYINYILTLCDLYLLWGVCKNVH